MYDAIKLQFQSRTITFWQAINALQAAGYTSFEAHYAVDCWKR